jgi:FtsH-binding integral membrane protein
MYAQSGARAGTVDQTAVDEGLRAYMLRVYNYMGSGLLLSGIVAILAFSYEPVFQALYSTAVTPRGVALQPTILGWIVMFSPLGLLFLMQHQFRARSASSLQATYWVFCALFGASISYIFALYAGGSIARVFFITAATFGALSLFGYTTKRDLSGMGSFLFMGLIGIIIASLVNIFLQSTMMQWVISVVGVLIFAGLTAYDTQRIKSEYVAYRMEGDLAVKSAVMGAVSLFLDFINLFMLLLSLLGNRE